MENDTTHIRHLMNLLENAAAASEPMLLEGWVDTLKGKIDHRLGNKEREKMAARLKQEWSKWLGQTRREGTMDDMVRFMTMRIGFKDNDIEEVLSQSGLPDDSEGSQDAAEPEKKIAPGKPAGNEPNEEDGIPLPKDLNAKLSDFGKVGIDVEKNDNKTEPGEIFDDPRKYKAGNGDWDRKKISARLAKMPMGDKLTLGNSTFSRKVGKPANESIMEAKNPDVLDRATVSNIMDTSAAYINDEYLMNGPQNVADAKAAQDAKAPSSGPGSRGGKVADTPVEPNTGGPKGSGQYDAKEMWNILKVDFQKEKSWLDTLTRKVGKATSISEMTDQDMADLSLVAFAFLRART